MAATGAKHTPFSLIGGDVVITGDVQASVDLHVDGRIEGDLTCANLVQGPDSVIHGSITASAARLAGKVDGAINADALVIEATARISGEVTYDTISVENGAQIDGRFTRKGGQPGELKLVAGD